MRIKKNINKVDVITFMMSIYFIMSYITLFIESMRYLKYALPFIAFIPWVYNKNTNTTKEYGKILSQNYISFYLKMYSAIFGIFLIIQIFQFNISFRFFANVLFVLLPLIFVYFLIPFINQNKINYYFNFILVGTIIGFILEKRETLVPTLYNLSAIFSGIEDSEIDTESNIYSFLLSLLLIYSVYFRSSKLISSVLFVLVILAFKRVIFVSLIVVLALGFFPFIYKIISKNRSATALLFSLLALTIISVYFLIVQGYFDNYLLSNFEMSTNALLKGRQRLYFIALENFGTLEMLIGSGIGFVDDLLTKYGRSINNVKNLHSELLRWFIETGGIIYTIWLYYFFKNSIQTKFCFILFIFLFILLLTDNVFIYFDTMWYFYLLSIFSIIRELKQPQQYRTKISNLN